MTQSLDPAIWANDRLRLVVTAACNINCFYCHNEGQPKGNTFFPDALFERVTELVAIRKPHSVTFTGGEALLHPRIEGFAARIRSYCPSVTIVTNGLLLTEEKIHRLAEAGVTKVRLGVDSLVRAKSRPSAGVFPAVSMLKVIDMLLASNLDLELNIVLTRFNLSEIPHLLHYCAERRFSAKVFEHVEVDNFGTADKPALIHSQPVVSFDKFRDVMDDSGVPLQFSAPDEFHGANYIFQGDGFSWRYCRYLCPFGLCYMTGTRIDPTGAMYVCMEKRFVELISSSEKLESTIEKAERVVMKGCRPVSK